MTLLKTMFAFTLLLVAACNAPDEPTPEIDMTDRQSTDRPHEPVADNLEAETLRAREDLARRLDVPLESIRTVVARRVTWNNGALGCPEPDMMYTQALVPGYFIRLIADDQSYAYHGSDGQQPFFCPADRSNEPPRTAPGTRSPGDPR